MEDRFKRGHVRFKGRAAVRVDDDDRLTGTVFSVSDQLVDAISRPNGRGSIAKETGRTVERTKLATEMRGRSGCRIGDRFRVCCANVIGSQALRLRSGRDKDQEGENEERANGWGSGESLESPLTDSTKGCECSEHD